jgi:hypothetical protein
MVGGPISGMGLLTGCGTQGKGQHKVGLPKLLNSVVCWRWYILYIVPLKTKEESIMAIKKDVTNKYLHVFKKTGDGKAGNGLIQHLVFSIPTGNRWEGPCYDGKEVELFNQELLTSLAELSIQTGHPLHILTDETNYLPIENIDQLCQGIVFQNSFRVPGKNVTPMGENGLDKTQFRFYKIQEKDLKHTLIEANSIVLVELNDDGISRIHLEIFKDSKPLISYPIVGEVSDNGLYLVYPELERVVYLISTGIFKKKPMINILNYKTGKRKIIKNV